MGGLIEYFRGLREVITRNRPQYVCNLIRAKLYSALHPGALTIAVLNGKDTIRLLKESRKSLIRWGDADTRAFLGGNLYYHAVWHLNHRSTVMEGG